MERTFVHFQLDLKNIGLINNMNFLWWSLQTFASIKMCGSIIDNRSDATIFVMEDNDRKMKINLKHDLKIFFVGLCTVECVYKITPC